MNNSIYCCCVRGIYCMHSIEGKLATADMQRMSHEYRPSSAICRKPLNRRSQRAKGNLCSKRLGACWGKPFMLTQRRPVGVTQLNSSSLQRTVQYPLKPHQALGMSLEPKVGMAPTPIWILLWRRLETRPGMQELHSILVFCQQVGSKSHSPCLPSPSLAPYLPLFCP